MKKIRFVYYPDGVNSATDEIFEFEDDVMQDEIDKHFKEWLMSQVSGVSWTEEVDYE